MKPCIICAKLVHKESTYCKSCRQLGERNSQFKHGGIKCERCGGKRSKLTNLTCRKCFREDMKKLRLQNIVRKYTVT